MPKKLQTNEKASAARERKANQKAEEVAGKKKADDDAYWADEGSTKKEKRAAEEAAKQKEKAAKAAAKKALEEKDQKELAAMKLAKSAKDAMRVSKVTQSDIEVLKQQRKEQEEEEEETRRLAALRIIKAPVLTRNVNQDIRDEEAKMSEGGKVLSASNIDDALKVTSSVAQKTDRHPEKRLKYAYRKYEDKRMPEMREDYPDLKFSQWKNMIWEEWQKAPENPLNQKDDE